MVLEDWLTVRGEENIGEGDSQVSELGYRARTISVLYTLVEVWLLRGNGGKEAFEEEDWLFSLIRVWYSLSNDILWGGVTIFQLKKQAEDLHFMSVLIGRGSPLYPDSIWVVELPLLLTGKLIQDLLGGHTTTFLISLSSLDKSLVQCPKAYFLLLLITSY